jgi:hypothetical protein
VSASQSTATFSVWEFAAFGHDHVLMPAMKVRVVDADLEALIGRQLIVGGSVLVHDIDLHGQQFIGKKSEGFSVQLGRIAHREMEVVVGGSVGIADKDPYSEHSRLCSHGRSPSL